MVKKGKEVLEDLIDNYIEDLCIYDKAFKNTILNKKTNIVQYGRNSLQTALGLCRFKKGD